jgi:predicted transcriptional regulator
MVAATAAKAGKHVTITIDKETYGKLEEIAQRNEMSVPAVVKQMVENYSLAEEDEEDSVE